VLCLVGRLKDLAAAAVLASTSRRSRVGLEEIEESIRYVPPEARAAVLDTMTKILSDVGKDTFTNIQSGAAILATRLIEPIMRKSMCA
jgi:hypothetical protein